MQGVAAFDAHFSATACWNTLWQLVGMAVTIVIMAFGIGRGIEKANKVMTPLFYLLFIGLAIYLVTLPGAGAGYQYIFVLKTRRACWTPWCGSLPWGRPFFPVHRGQRDSDLRLLPEPGLQCSL